MTISDAGMRYLICIVRWSIISIELVEITNRIGTNWKKWKEKKATRSMKPHSKYAKTLVG